MKINLVLIAFPRVAWMFHCVSAWREAGALNRSFARDGLLSPRRPVGSAGIPGPAEISLRSRDSNRWLQ